MNTTSLPCPVRDGDEFDVADDLALGFAPHCPGCLCTAQPWEAGRGAAWRCPQCDLALIG